MKKFLLFAVLSFTFSYAHAREDARSLQGILSPPPEVTTVLSIDAHNSVIIGTRDPKAPDAPEKFTPFSPRHIYSGVLGRLFGGAITTTEEFVIPESALFSGAGNLGANQGSSGNRGAISQGFSNQNARSFNRGFSLMMPQG